MKILSPWATLLIIFAFFLVPLLLAWFMYTGVIEFEPESTRNYGILVEPQIPVSWSGMKLENSTAKANVDQEGSSVAAVLNGHWVILYLIQPLCQSDCISHVTLLRQIHRAAGRHQERVRIALVAPGWMSADTRAKLSAVYSQFTLISDPEHYLSKPLAAAADAASNRAGHSTYLIDPLGNLMMFYSAGSDPNDINKDLKLLLTWSKLDQQ